MHISELQSETPLSDPVSPGHRLVWFVLSLFFKRLFVEGTLIVTRPDGRVERFGSGTPEIHAAVTDWKTCRHMIFDPALAFGEAYMDGTLVVQGPIYGLLEMIIRNMHGTSGPGMAWFLARLRTMLKPIRQFNHRRRSRANVHHHYDLSPAFYDLFLDRQRIYSCAYFARPDMTLDAAQEAKLRRISAKLRLDPGLEVLDIGCGWGGLALHIAEHHGCRVTGITLSTEQLASAQAEAARRGLDDRVSFRLLDYREAEGSFDRIVSVGMFEHVGINQYGAYFAAMRRLLKDDGYAMLHSIGSLHEPYDTNPWIAKYIFPGGYAPSLSETIAQIETSGLYMGDTEIWQFHYAETLKAWRQRFDANRDKARAMYDERLCRMWEFYLAGSEAAFRYSDQMVFQMILGKTRQAVSFDHRPNLTEAAYRE